MWLPSKSRSSKLQGAQAVRVAKLWERWAAGAPSICQPPHQYCHCSGRYCQITFSYISLFIFVLLTIRPVLYASVLVRSLGNPPGFFMQNTHPHLSLRDLVGAKQMARTMQQTPVQAKGCLPFPPPPLEKQCPPLPSENFAFWVKMVHFVYKKNVDIFRVFLRKVQLSSE